MLVSNFKLASVFVIAFQLGFVQNSNAEFSYEDFQKLVISKNIRTTEKLVEELPEIYKGHYTFIYKSESLQAPLVSPEYPRVILYGPDAKFILAFVEPNQTSSTSSVRNSMVETIEFQDNKFIFRELNFDGKKNPFESGAIEKNPTNCLGCHQSDPRPLWNEYNMWNGVYGSLDRLYCSTIAEGSPENSMYKKFINGNRRKGIYSHLPSEMSLESVDCPSGNNRITVANAFSSRPNKDFGDSVTKLDIYRKTRLINESANIDRFRYVLAALNQRRCASYKNIEVFFNNGPYEHSNQTLAEVFYEVDNQSDLEFEALKRSFDLFNPSSPSDEKTGTFVPIHPLKFADTKYVKPMALNIFVLRKMGISLEQMATIPFKRGLHLEGRLINFFQVYYKLRSQDEELQSFSCLDLCKLSRESFGNGHKNDEVICKKELL